MSHRLRHPVAAPWLVAPAALLVVLGGACASGPDPADDSAGDARAPASPSTPATPATPATPVTTPAGRGTDGPVAVRRLRAEPYAFTHHSGFSDSARIVARDAATWARAWDKIHERGSPRALPTVAFADSMVVIVALGVRNTGGYGILVDGAARVRDTLAITVRRIAPGARCGTAAALSQPVDIALLPRLQLPVRWVEKAEVTNCP